MQGSARGVMECWHTRAVRLPAGGRQVSGAPTGTARPSARSGSPQPTRCLVGGLCAKRQQTGRAGTSGEGSRQTRSSRCLREATVRQAGVGGLPASLDMARGPWESTQASPSAQGHPTGLRARGCPHRGQPVSAAPAVPAARLCVCWAWGRLSRAISHPVHSGAGVGERSLGSGTTGDAERDAPRSEGPAGAGPPAPALTEVGLVGAALEPHALRGALDQEVPDQLVGQVTGCGGGLTEKKSV